MVARIVFPMELRKLEISQVWVRDIHVHPENPRRGDVEAIIQSIVKNGVYRPLVVSRVSGNILAGNHTFRALCEMGASYVDVVYIDGLDVEGERRIMLADNRTAELGDGYDDAALIALLDSLDGDLEGTGWSDDDYTDLLDGLVEDAGGAGEDVEGHSGFGVMVECASRADQLELLGRLGDMGLVAKPVSVHTSDL